MMVSRRQSAAYLNPAIDKQILCTFDVIWITVILLVLIYKSFVEIRGAAK